MLIKDMPVTGVKGNDSAYEMTKNSCAHHSGWEGAPRYSASHWHPGLRFEGAEVGHDGQHLHLIYGVLAADNQVSPSTQKGRRKRLTGISYQLTFPQGRGQKRREVVIMMEMPAFLQAITDKDKNVGMLASMIFVFQDDNILERYGYITCAIHETS